MPILNVSPEERKLIPLRLQAQYELGRVSKKELDAYLSRASQDSVATYESNFQPGKLQPPAPKEDDPWAAPFPVQEPTGTFDAMGQRWTGTSLQKEGSSEATSLMTALDEIELLNTDPLALDKKYEDTVKASQDYVKQFSNSAREPSATKLANFSSELERLKKAKEAAKDPKKVAEYKAEIQGKLKAALTKRAEGANLVQQADPSLSGGTGFARAITDAGANWKQFLPQVGGTLGGLAAGAMAAETGPGAIFAAKAGQAGGAALFAIPLAYEVYDQAAATVLANGGTTAEARASAAQQVAVEFGAEVAASMIPGGKAATLRTAAKGGAGAGRVVTEALKQGARQVVEEELTTDLSQALDMRALGNGDTAAMEATYQQNLPFGEDGKFDINRALDERYQQGLSSFIGGSVQSVPGTIIQNNQLNTKFGELKGAAKEALAQRKEQLQQLGFKGTDLANQLAQEANVLSATVGVDSADIFTAKDFVPEEVKIDEEIFAQSKKDLEESIRLRPNDPFTAGQIQGMQLVEQNKSVLDADRFKGTPDWQGQKVSPSAIPLPGDLGAFAVEAPTRSEGWSTATPQPTAEVTVGKPRVNLTERSGGFKPAEQSAPTVTKTTATTNLPLEKRSRNMVQTRDKLLQDVQKFAGTKIDPKAIDKQKTKIGAALAEAERQLNFEGAFEGLDANQQEDTLRKKALEFLSSGKKIEDITAEFDKATETTPDYRTQNIDAAGRFLTDSDESRTRLAKNIGDPALVDNLVKAGKIVLVPSFEGKKAPDGTVLQDNNQAFIYNGDTIFVNAARLGDKTPRPGDKEVNKELAYAIVGHEYTHKRESSGESHPLLKQMIGDSPYAELNKIIEAYGSENVTAGKIGEIARTAIKRADEAVARGEVKSRGQEAPNYFLEELLLSYNGPLGKLRKYVDLGTAAIRDAYTKAGGSIKTVRPQDLAYIIGKDIKREAQGKGKAPIRDTSNKTPKGDKPQSKSTSNADKPKVQNSFIYRGSLKASKEIREGKGTTDPVYDEPVIEISDKDAKFDYKKFSDAGLTGKMGEVYDHPELYEYYPSLKDAKLNVDKDIKWNEGYYNSSTNTITISDRAFNTLNYPAEPGTSADKAKQKVLEETNSIIIHEIQHAIQNRRGFNAKGSNQAAEADLYRRSAYTRPNLTELKESRVDRAADWAYRANAGEIMARAAEYAYKGKMPDGTPVANGIEAAKIIKQQFAKTIKSPQDRKEFFEWFDKEIADTDKMVRFSTADDSRVVDMNSRLDAMEAKESADIAGGMVAREQRDKARNLLDWLGNNTGLITKARNIQSAISGYDTILAGPMNDAEKAIEYMDSVLNAVTNYIDNDQPLTFNQDIGYLNKMKKPLLDLIEAAQEWRDAANMRQPDERNLARQLDKYLAGSVVQFSTASDKPFYSALVRAVETGQGMPKKAAPTQWKQWLDGAQRRGDFKQSERDWMGIDAWLDGRDITTREQLVDFVRLNQVDVQETVLGGKATGGLTGAEKAEFEALSSRYRLDPDSLNSTEYWRYVGLERQDFDTSEPAEKTKFASYQLPGGENYRELLITMPVKGLVKPVGEIVEDGKDKDFPFAIMVDGVEANRSRSGGRIAQDILQEEIDRATARATKKSAENYESSHFPGIANPLAHVRFNERTDADGNKVLFVEEVQSDWHQAGRKHGYKPKLNAQNFSEWTAAKGISKVEMQRLWDNQERLTGDDAKTWANWREHADAFAAGVPDAPLKKEWPLTAMKRVIRYAAENDFDKVAWTTGDQQAERYDMRHQVNSIAIPTVNEDGSRAVRVETTDSNSFKMVVDKNGMVAGYGAAGQFSGKALDEVIGKEMAEKVMAAPEGTKLSGDDLKIGGEGMRVFYDKMLPNELNKYVKKWDGKVGRTDISVQDKKQAAIKWDGANNVEPNVSVPSIEITPKMKEAALQGQVLFSTADVIKNTIKSITNNKYVKGATVGMTPDKARIIDETSKNMPKLYEARMNYAIRNLQKTVSTSKTPWEKIEAGWKRMIETKTLKPVTGDKNVDGALVDMRMQIANLTRGIRDAFKQAGIPMPKSLDETLEANLWSYISRSFDIDYNQNYGKDYLNEVKKDPSGEKKKKLDNLIRFFQVGLVRDLQNLGTLDDERVKQIHDMLVGAGSPSIAEKRADLKAFVGSRKQSELTEALVNDVLRLNKTNRLAGFYRGSSRDTSILKTRKDVPQAIREVWGERTGVLEGAMTTIIRQARLIAETQAQADLIRRIPEDFSKTATSTLTERIDNSVDKYGPLAGMYTTPDMKNYVTERVQQYETTDSLLFDIHSVQTQNKAAADTIVGLFNQYAKRIGQLKGWTVLGELINYPYNLIGMVQAAVFKGPNSVTYTDSKGNKVPISNWGKQFVYDLIKGEVGPKTTELYQEMVKYGMLGSALMGDIQEAFVTELKHNSSLPKKVWNGFGHFFNVAFGGPELLSTGLTFVNEANFLRDLWTAQGKKFTHDELMMEAADRTKRTTISRDRAMVFAKFGDRLGPSTYFTFFSETIRAPITNIIMANQMRKSAEGMNPEAAKIAKSYAMRQFVGGVVGISLTLAIHNLLAKLMGSEFGDEPDEVAEALPEGMRIGAKGLLVLGEDNGGVKFLYNPDMANTYSALFDPIKSAIKGNFADAGKQLMDLQFVNPVVRQAYRAANGELGPSEDGFTADVNTFLSEIGLANSGFTIPIINVEPFAPQTVSRIPKLSAGVEPSAIRPLWDLAWGTKDASDFGGALGLTMTLLGARPYRYAPKKSADWSITKVGEQSKEMVANLNEVVRDRNNSKATIKAQVERFYDEEYEMLKEHYKVIKAAKAAGMTNDELKTLMKGAFLSKTLIASLLSDTGDYYMTEFGGSWLEISEMKKILNMTPKEEALTLEGYRANKEIFFEVFKEKFGTKEK